MIKGIIFDMDGTLIDSIGMHKEIWQSVLEIHGIEVDSHLFDEVNGMVTLDIAQFVIDKYKINADAHQIAAEKQKLSGRKLEDGVKLYDDVKETLVLLKRLGLRIGVGTSTPRAHAIAALGSSITDLEFDAIVAGDEVENGKPAPDIFLKCAEEMQLHPDECMVVEDAINGIQAAKNCGMKAVAITNTTPAEKFTMADSVIKHIKEINSNFIQKIASL